MHGGMYEVVPPDNWHNVQILRVSVQSPAQMGMQAIVNLESIHFDTLEIKVTRSPSFEKGSRKRTDSGPSIKQTATAYCRSRE